MMTPSLSLRPARAIGRALSLAAALFAASCAPVDDETFDPTGETDEDDTVTPTGEMHRSGVEELHSSNSGRQVVYLHFNGGVIRRGPWADNNAQANTSHIAQKINRDIRIPPFNVRWWGGDRNVAIRNITAYLRNYFRGYNVVFTTTRPAGGPYTMMMIGGTPAIVNKPSNHVGLAPYDPGNRNLSDVGFVFSDSIGAKRYKGVHLAAIIAHELGHTFGLAHNGPSNAIMYYQSCHCTQYWTANDRNTLRARFPY